MFETRKEEASVEEIRELKERLERERPVEWEAFPDIGLYMDQLISYMPRQLIHYGEGESLTSAMVNNYIKDGAMPRAEGKRYSRTHLAYLTALCALKQVLSVKDAGLLLAAASEGRPPQKLYEQFREELDRALDVTAGSLDGSAEAEELRRRGGDKGEFGATTGRPRRVGWFDAVATKYGCMVQGATQVALTCLDVLGYLDEIQVCTGYEIDGKVTKDFPVPALLERAKPVFTTLPGWKSDIRGITDYDALPANAKAYVDFIEKEIETPIRIVSTGPKRHEITLRG